MKIKPSEFSFKSKSEAEHILDQMKIIIDSSVKVSIFDFNALVGLPIKEEDVLWGWTNLNDVRIKKSHKRYFIEFSQAKLIS